MLDIDRYGTKIRALIALLLLLVVPAMAGGIAAQAAIEVDINRGVIRPIPIIVADFRASQGSQSKQNFGSIIRADLANSGFFRDVGVVLVTADNRPAGPIDFDRTRRAGAEIVLDGEYGLLANGDIEVRFRLWDVITEKQLLARTYIGKPSMRRRLAHWVADDVYTHLTGYESYFDSQIAFVEESGPRNARNKRLALMDQDGFGIRYLTAAAGLVLTPRFSPDGRTLLYLRFKNRNVELRIYDLNNDRDIALGNFANVQFAPRFSPDGSTVAMSLQEGGNSNLYLYRFADRTLVRLTARAAIDTAPSFSPDGRQIVFESDRSGSQQLYIMPARGGSPKRITYGKGRYSTPSWSPRGDLIAFTKQSSGQFSIGVIRPDGSDEDILVDGYHNEAPSWAPDGRTLIFFRETRGRRGGPSLWRASIVGIPAQKLATPHFASDPAWSPQRRSRKP